MKKLLLLSLFALLAKLVCAQDRHADSLINLAVSRAEMSGVKPNVNRDSLFNLLPATTSSANRIKLIYQVINYGKGIAKKGLTYHYKILDWTKKSHDKICEVVITSELGYIFDLNGDKVQSTQIAKKSLQMAIATGDNQAIAIAYLNLPTVANAQLNKINSFKTLQYAKIANDKQSIGYAYTNLANLYRQSGKMDSAKYYARKGLEYVTKENMPELTVASILSLALTQPNDELKFRYYIAAEKIVSATRDTADAVIVYNTLAKAYYKKHQVNLGLTYASKSYSFSTNLSFSDKLLPAILLSKLFTGVNTDSALKYTQLYYNLRDSAYNLTKMQAAQALELAQQQQGQEAAAKKTADENRQRLIILAILIAFLILLAIVFWRSNLAGKKANTLLQQQKEEIQLQKHRAEAALLSLQATQTQLIQSEKMASLGELTAGIAHEIQNPLNFVNNFSEVSVELLQEMNEELDKGDMEEAKAIGADLKQNLEKIHHHGKRADFIVKGMLQHSRASTGEKQLTNINVLADEFLKLSYHGLRAKDKSFNAELVTNYDESLPKVNIAQQDIGRVLLNLFTNAFYAVNEKKKTAGNDYKPTVTLTTFAPPSGGWGASVADNGNGIPDAIKEKIMQPFFTTKPTGEGTGLGLSLSYDIVVKGHGGSLDIKSIEGDGSEFIVIIPVSL